MIDQIEKMALDFVGFENFLDLTKTQTLKDLKEIEEVLKGRKVESSEDSMEHLPTLAQQKKPSGQGAGCANNLDDQI